MNKFDETLIEWSEQELNVKNCTKESLNLLRGKNGMLFKKLLSFMSQHIKSKETGETIKRFCNSVDLKEEIKVTTEDIRDIESDMNRLRNQLIAEELHRKSIEMKDQLNDKKLFVTTLLLDVIDKISAKNKLCFQLNPNLKPIYDTISCCERLFSSSGVLDSEQCLSSDDSVNYNKNLDNLLDQINQLVESIGSIVYDLSDMKVAKPTKISYDLELVSNGLTKCEPNIEVMPQTNENDVNCTAISTKLVSVHNLINKYQTIRSEKLAKNKDKMQKVINSCDTFIQQNA